MAASRFTGLSEEKITQLLNDKDSENTKKLTKYHRLIFESYLKDKNIRNPSTAVDLAAVQRTFTPRQKRKMDRCTQELPLFHQICFHRCRHLNQELNIDILKYMEFNEANRVYLRPTQIIA